MTIRLHRGDLPDLSRYKGSVAIDTETMGLDPRRDRLCVVQLSPGDGSADVKPIAHLYKTQVYALARALNIPDEVCNARPTTDTYSLAQGQDEFYFPLPYEKMDLALWSYNHRVDASELAPHVGLSAEETQVVYADIESKRRTTAHLHARPALVESVFEASR